MNREDIINTIPKSYNSTMHKLIPTLVGFFVLLLCAINLTLHLWMIPVVLVVLFFSFGFEWYVHKNVLHCPKFLLETIHYKHIAHHALYTDQDMSIRNTNETHFILMPTYAIFVILTLVSPSILALYYLFGLDLALIVLATMTMFFLTYEWLHYSYHLPLNSFWGSRLHRLREHHRKHHNPEVMTRMNFNVTIPVFDTIMKTRV